MKKGQISIFMTFYIHKYKSNLFNNYYFNFIREMNIHPLDQSKYNKLYCLINFEYD